MPPRPRTPPLGGCERVRVSKKAASQRRDGGIGAGCAPSRRRDSTGCSRHARGHHGHPGPDPGPHGRAPGCGRTVPSEAAPLPARRQEPHPAEELGPLAPRSAAAAASAAGSCKRCWPRTGPDRREREGKHRPQRAPLKHRHPPRPCRSGAKRAPGAGQGAAERRDDDERVHIDEGPHQAHVGERPPRRYASPPCG